MSHHAPDNATRPAPAAGPVLPRWKRRFLAPSLTVPSWAADAPDRLVYAANVSGAWQVHAWDRRGEGGAGGTHRQVTDHPTGTLDGTITPDGERVLWFSDDRGDEVGRWLSQPFAGGAEPVPLLPDVPAAWSAGLALGPDGLAAVGLAGRDGFSVRVGRAGGTSREVYRHEQTADVAGLSRDGKLLLVSHCEHGDNRHPALRAYDAASGTPLADLWDGPGNAVYAAGFSPVPGDGRVAVLHERTGRLRPAVWSPDTGAFTDPFTATTAGAALPDFPGELEVADWWPDAGALLLVHAHLGRDELWRLDLDPVAATRLDHPAGSVSGARVRPDGTVWYRASSGALPPAVRAVGTDRPVLTPEATVAGGNTPAPGWVPEPAPPGVAYESWTFPNPAGDRVHGFLVVPPDAPGPHPTVMLVHGGPHHADTDAYSPQVQAWVDHGFAVALVNYRGSTGYGKAWQDALDGDPGRKEVEDVTAGRDDLVARGIADPDRVVLAGASWGGYVTLLGIGTVPGGWRAAAAVVPIADYVSAYANESEGIQALDRTLFGGDPDDVPDLYRDRSPITYAGRIRTPVLLMVGENDTRCPLQQVLNYEARLRELGRPVELDRFDAGHGALVTGERVRQMDVLLDFAARHIPGALAPGEAI